MVTRDGDTGIYRFHTIGETGVQSGKVFPVIPQLVSGRVGTLVHRAVKPALLCLSNPREMVANMTMSPELQGH